MELFILKSCIKHELFCEMQIMIWWIKKILFYYLLPLYFALYTIKKIVKASLITLKNSFLFWDQIRELLLSIVKSVVIVDLRKNEKIRNNWKYILTNTVLEFFRLWIISYVKSKIKRVCQKNYDSFLLDLYFYLKLYIQSFVNLFISIRALVFYFHSIMSWG